ncbi:MAG: radical SAM protein [Pyrobaculum sp.]
MIVTENCNFRCVYCYERFQPNIMDKDVSEGVINLIKVRAPELWLLQISWFGGEPMLYYRYIINFMKAIEEYKHDNLKIVGDISTNGYLLDLEKLKNLLKHHVKLFQITLDGDKTYHDKVRVKADGGPTFEKIWNNIITASRTDLDFEFILRIHVHRDNVDSVKNLLAMIASVIGSDRRFRIFIRPIGMFGGPNDHLIKTPDLATVGKLREYAKSLGLRVLEGKGVCYASALNSFVVYPDGRVGKCTVALYDEKNIVGRINRDGSLTLDGDKILWWARGILRGDFETASCPYAAPDARL